MAGNQLFLVALYHSNVYPFSWGRPFGVFYRNKLGKETPLDPEEHYTILDTL